MDLNIAVKTESKQYIGITIGIEQYGIDISFVDNIVKMQKLTRVPKAQTYFLGVINIRGEIIPVMSLRLKFGLEPDKIGPKTRILIIKPDKNSAVGIIVDEVKEVFNISEDEIDKAPQNNDETASYVLGVGKHEKGLITLLNIMSVISERKEEQ